MLYIKKESCLKKLPEKPKDVEIISAENSCLTPDCSAMRIFLSDWNGEGCFRAIDLSDNNKRRLYERLRRLHRKVLDANTGAQKTIAHVIDRTIEGRDTIITVKENRPFPNSVRRLLVELFYAAGIKDIETDRNINPGKVRAMDALSKNPQTNTALSYQMLDPCPVPVQTIFIGAITYEQIAPILDACKDVNGSKRFVPAAIGLPTPNAAGTGPWAEFYMDKQQSFRQVPDLPDNEATVEDAVRLFQNMNQKWDAVAKQIVLQSC